MFCMIQKPVCVLLQLLANFIELFLVLRAVGVPLLHVKVQ